MLRELKEYAQDPSVHPQGNQLGGQTQLVPSIPYQTPCKRVPHL